LPYGVPNLNWYIWSMPDLPLLSISNLNISFAADKQYKQVIHEVSLDVPQGKIVGIVGESGSGKSVSSLAIMGLLPKRTSRIEGSIRFEDKELLGLDPKQMRKLRGNEIAMIFQEPMSALNPSMRCGPQVVEMIRMHTDNSTSVAKVQVIELFKKVKLPRPNEIFSSYPHQISGGQMQRVMIAMALACEPKLIIADEPTTALDVTVQKEIIELLKELQKETGMSMIFISHDLGLVSQIADRVVVMYQGRVVEEGSVFEVFKMPKASYTKALLASRPSMNTRLERLPTIASLSEKSFNPKEIAAAQRALKHKKLYTQTPLLEIRNVKKVYFDKAGMFGKKRTVLAVDGVNFDIYAGETVGLVGESGCGKSTLGKVIMQLEPATEGSVKYNGTDLTKLDKTQIRSLRKDIQLIFQDPYASLNPRLTLGNALTEPMKVHGIGKSAVVRKRRALELLDKVGLDREFYDRYPHELSGGQRQRIGVARAIALEPKLVICDESVSALDISVQAQVLNLLNELKEEFGFTYLFISHDLAVVKYMSDQLLVMKEGKIVERGEADEVYANPVTAYSKALIEAIPKGL